jgi:hypothetical protein
MSFKAWWRCLVRGYCRLELVEDEQYRCRDCGRSVRPYYI